MVVNVSFVVQFRRLKPVIRHSLVSNRNFRTVCKCAYTCISNAARYDFYFEYDSVFKWVIVTLIFNDFIINLLLPRVSRLSSVFVRYFSGPFLFGIR